MKKKKVGLFLALALALTIALYSGTSNLDNYAIRDTGALSPIFGTSEPGGLPPL